MSFASLGLVNEIITKFHKVLMLSVVRTGFTHWEEVIMVSPV